MNHKSTLISIVMAATVLVSLFAVVSSAASVSGMTMAGTGPAMTSSPYSAGLLDVFAVDTNGTLWHTSISGSGNAWDSLGGASTASPAAVSWSSSYFRIDVFVRGSGGGVWWKYYDNGWSGWIPLGGQVAAGTGPAVASWSEGRLDVFVEGTNGALWHKWYTGTSWSSWESLGGQLTASPAAVSPFTSPPNLIEVFARGSEGAIWQKSYSNGWSSWHSLGGQVAAGTGPGVNQHLNLFIQGTDHQLWQKDTTYTAFGWTAWCGLGGAPPEALSTSSPASVLNVQDNTTVCVSGTSGNIWYSVYGSNNPNWSQWTSAGSPP
jgi:hypothetical protein